MKTVTKIAIAKPPMKLEKNQASDNGQWTFVFKLFKIKTVLLKAPKTIRHKRLFVRLALTIRRRKLNLQKRKSF
jgi:hypothetical protein